MSSLKNSPLIIIRYSADQTRNIHYIAYILYSLDAIELFTFIFYTVFVFCLGTAVGFQITAGYLRGVGIFVSLAMTSHFPNSRRLQQGNPSVCL